MLAIKLQRIGKKHQPSYRLVVAEKRSKLGAPPVEDLGSYNPKTKTVNVKGERVTYWIENGAQPTVSAHNLLVNKSVLKLENLAVKMKKAVAKPVVVKVEAKGEDVVTEAPAVAETAPVEEVAS